MLEHNNIKHVLYCCSKKIILWLIKKIYALSIYVIKIISILNNIYIHPIIKKIENNIYQQACDTFDCHKQQVR